MLTISERQTAAALCVSFLATLVPVVGHAQGSASSVSSSRSSVSGVSRYRSQTHGGSGYLSTGSEMSWSKPTLSENTTSEMRWSDTRESRHAPSELRPSEFRRSEGRTSDPRWSEDRESDMKWSDVRDSTGIGLAFNGTGAVTDARDAVGRPMEPPAPVVTDPWERAGTEIGDERERLPPVYSTVNVGGKNYFYFDERYYAELRQDGALTYVVVKPPVGAAISRLPYGCEPTVVGNYQYYLCPDDVWYFQTTTGYEVCRSPR